MHSTEPGFDSTEISNSWIAAHIQQGHGPLGAIYPDVSFVMSAAGSSDPDGDSLTYLWFQYPEAGSYKDEIKLGYAENYHTVTGQAPAVAKTETAHFIVKVSDRGSPALTRYRRVIVIFVPSTP